MNIRRFFIRDIRTVGRKERIAAGIVSTIVGGALIVYMETSEGATLEGSLLRVCTSACMAVTAVKVYNRYQKNKQLEGEKEKRKELTQAPFSRSRKNLYPRGD